MTSWYPDNDENLPDPNDPPPKDFMLGKWLMPVACILLILALNGYPPIVLWHIIVH